MPSSHCWIRHFTHLLQSSAVKNWKQSWRVEKKWHCKEGFHLQLSTCAAVCGRRLMWPVLNNGVVTRGSSFTRGMESERAGKMKNVGNWKITPVFKEHFFRNATRRSLHVQYIGNLSYACQWDRYQAEFEQGSQSQAKSCNGAPLGVRDSRVFTCVIEWNGSALSCKRVFSHRH